MKTHVIAYEGLFGGLGRWLQRGLIDPMLKKHPGKFTVSYHHWGSSGPSAVDADRIIVATHSFGAKGIDWAAQYGKPIHGVLSIDVRRPSLFVWSPYAKPSNVGKMVHLYQTGFMRGYPVAGAENIHITDGTGHTAMPCHPRVHAEFEEMLK